MMMDTDPKQPQDSNALSWLLGCTDLSDDGIMAFLRAQWPAQQTLCSILAELQFSQPKGTKKLDLASLREHVRLFNVNITARKPEYIRMGDGAHAILIDIFLDGIPDAKTRMHKFKIPFLGVTWTEFSQALLTYIDNKILDADSNDESSPVTDRNRNRDKRTSTSAPTACRNCKLTNHATRDCTKPCTKRDCVTAFNATLSKDPNAVIHRRCDCPPTPKPSSSTPQHRPTPQKSQRRGTNQVKASTANPDSQVVIIDSGSGVTTVPTLTLLDSSPRRPTNPMVLQTASSEEICPTLIGDFRGIDAHLVPDFNNIILGLSDLLTNNFALATDKDMVVFSKNKRNKKLFKEFRDSIIQSVKFTANVIDGVYQIGLEDLPKTLNSNQHDSSPTMLHRMANVIHRYQTANFSSISDLVKFFHELLGHPSIETMISILESSSVTNFPPELTIQAVRKYFPFNCISCPAGQLARRPPLAPETTTTSLPGEEFEVDFKGPWHNADGKQVLSLSRNKLMFTAVDVHKGFVFTCGTSSTAHPVKHLEKLRLFALKRTGNRLRVIRSDDDFWDTSIREWASRPEINVTLLPCIPHEHDRVKRVERMHRTLSEMTNKCLAFKPHLGDPYWELCYKHCADLQNIRPKKKLDGKSPFEIYFGKPYDFITHPIFPFGSVIMSHTPTAHQTSLGHNGNETYYVGIAHDHNGGARFYNPITKLTITRHSFKFVDTVDPVSPTYLIDPSVPSLINCPSIPPSVPPTQLLTKKGPTSKTGPTRTSGTTKSLEEPDPLDFCVVESNPPPFTTDKKGPTPCEHSPTMPADHNVQEAGPTVLPNTRTSSRNKKPIDRYVPDMHATYPRNPPPRSFPIPEQLSPMLVHFGKTGASISPVTDPVTILQDVLSSPSDDPRWTHTPLDYKVAPVDIRHHYDNIGRTFHDKQANMHYEIVDICTSSAPAPHMPMITYKYYDTSVFSAPPSNDDMYEYEGVDFLLAETQYEFTTKKIRYLQRRINQLKTRKQYTVPTIPLSVKQARQHQYAAGFMAALNDELSSLKNMSTFKEFTGDPTTIPKGKLIHSKIIFDIVYNPDGTFKKFKARLVARGDQFKATDPNNYAGTIKSETMRILLAIVAEFDLDHDSLDVKTAFLYPTLKPEDTAWLKRPSGLTDDDMPAIVQLIKSLYGLPKASQYFEEFLANELFKLGFKRTISDQQLFILEKDGNICYVSTHVDDIFLASTKDSGLNDWVHDQLKKVFTLTHRPNTNVHLGLVIERNRPSRWLKISQPSYAAETLTRFQIDSDHPKVDSPMSETYLSNMKLHASDPVLSDSLIELYQQQIGCLQYLAEQSRPDLKLSVNLLSRKTKVPTSRDLRAARRVLYYLEQTQTDGIIFCTYGLPFELYVTTDASYACHLDSKSHTGASFHLGRFSGSFMSSSKKQKIIADSSTVAEFIGAHTSCQNIAWITNLLTEMKIQLTQPTTLYQDNMSTINILYKKGNEARTKHIDLRFNSIREFIQQRRITVKHLSTDYMIADTLTKPLSGPSFLRHKIRLLNLSPPTDTDLTLL
jgi:hypothetical protein